MNISLHIYLDMLFIYVIQDWRLSIKNDLLYSNKILFKSKINGKLEILLLFWSGKSQNCANQYNIPWETIALLKFCPWTSNISCFLSTAVQFNVRKTSLSSLSLVKAFSFLPGGHSLKPDLRWRQCNIQGQLGSGSLSQHVLCIICHRCSLFLLHFILHMCILQNFLSILCSCMRHIELFCLRHTVFFVFVAVTCSLSG